MWGGDIAMIKNNAQNIIDLFGILYRNTIREDEDPVEAGSSSRSAVLSVLRRKGSCKMTDLSRYLRVTKPNITFLVDKLEKQGLLMRKTYSDDRRTTYIQLTDKGLKEIEQKKMTIIGRINRHLERLNGDDLQYLEEKLPEIIRILSKLYSPG